MRRSLEFVALAALAAVWVMSAYALLGPSRLPDRIPTHFNFSGKPDGWGSPQLLWILPGFGSILYAGMTIVTRFPEAFNYPARVTPANRAVLQGLALRMIAWLKVEVMCLFAGIQYVTIESARRGGGALPPFSMGTAIVVVFGTIGWHVIAMRRSARSN